MKFVSKISILLTFFIIACTQQEKKLIDQTLIFAGNNRCELVNFLDHYKNDPEKLIAAQFVVMNIPGHLGIKSSDIDIYNQFIINILKSPKNTIGAVQPNRRKK